MNRVTRRQIDAFRRACHATPYVAKGMFYSEVFLFLQICREQNVDLIIESGVRSGVSTRVLAATSVVPIISIDRGFTIEPQPGVTFVEGDALEVVPRLIVEHPHAAIGLLLDGPKGSLARTLKDVCLVSPAVRVVAIHDEAPGAGEFIHSHDPEFRQRYGASLDALLASHPYAGKYPDGPGIAVWGRP